MNQIVFWAILAVLALITLVWGWSRRSRGPHASVPGYDAARPTDDHGGGDHG